MPQIIDLGGAPANEPCAQLGHTPDFRRINQLEVHAYRAAIQARFGPPPPGCALVTVHNAHDFGVYLTLGLKITAPSGSSEEVDAYATAVEDGLSSWLEAGFAPPVEYDDAVAYRVRSDIDGIIMGALSTTRPAADGRFPIPDFAVLHANLARAFPRQAQAFRQSLGQRVAA